MTSSLPWSEPGDDPSSGSVLTPVVDSTASAAPVESGTHPVSLKTLSEKLHTDAAIPSIGITILAILAVIYTLYFGHDFFVPVVFALLLNFLLSPLIRAARRIGIPPAASAAVVILATIGILGTGAYELAAPAREWLNSAPATFSKAEVKLRRLLKPVDQVTKTAEQVVKETSAASGSGPAPTSVVVQGPSMRARLFGTTQSLMGAILEVLVLLYFLLAAGDLFLQKLIKVLPQLQDKKTAVQIAKETESSISMYLMTSALLNVMEGSVVALVMYLLHMPDAILWGALVAVFEFIPYVGAAAVVVILTIASLTVFDTAAHALLIPGAFLTINLLQGNLVSPLVLGHRLALNPVAMFIGLAFWWELWGVAGAFLAVPLLATMKIFCDHIDTLAPIGEFLGRREDTIQSGKTV
ncbi:MAG TPA: AI-2E family transporter [Gemmatimonadaceae bacterium]|jgi:predicted PurR-regulated permease PerM|nr:AI-2E family transporter [Gemmatimonadaceae bacterium]